MTIASPAPRWAKTAADIVALQSANRFRAYAIPAVISGVVLLLSLAITIVIDLAGGRGANGDNAGILWAFSGYQTGFGVGAVTSAFPLALALGTTRRAFVAGTLLTAVWQSCYVTSIVFLLYLLERATGGFFVGSRIFTSRFVGGGDPLVLVVTFLLAMLVAMTVGGVLGASWIRFGRTGPIAIGIGVLLVAGAALVVALPALAAIVAAFQPWWLAVAAVPVIAAAVVGQVLLLRGAAVR